MGQTRNEELPRDQQEKKAVAAPRAEETWEGRMEPCRSCKSGGRATLWELQSWRKAKDKVPTLGKRWRDIIRPLSPLLSNLLPILLVI